ncbi:Alpha/Beta hydrolase protein [Gigaspora rosea]|uniref:Alpha/Beta hydrolase protein n=1 Tax=Gigaspora rosea TaxID=44941 RepID=A0A397UML5_9GLOM|nr:Alpha/Beta hydrolase protein [Gigaspora rosea]
MNSIHFTFLFFINILTFVTSSPIHIISDQSKSFNPPTPSSSNGISILSNDEIPDLTRFVTYSAASYCSNSADWTCGTYCEQIPDTTVIKTITTKPAKWVEKFGQDATAYCTITRNSKYKEIVVTFRGTANTGNTVKDYEVVQCSYGFGSTTVPIISKPVGALVHFGFYTAFLTFQQELRKVISESIKQYPDYKLVVTGHSLGGALASFAALDLKQSGANPCLYTYGEPRIGNTVFASFMYKTLDTMRRVVNQADEVPHLIPRVDYIHHQGEIWIANTTANQAVKCSGEENKLCSDSVPSKDWNNVDHDGPYWGLLIATSSCK